MEKKFLDIKGEEGWTGVYIAIFVKKMHFSGRKWQFFEKFILNKNYQWPKIQFLSGLKIFFFCFIQS